MVLSNEAIGGISVVAVVIVVAVVLLSVYFSARCPHAASLCKSGATAPPPLPALGWTPIRDGKWAVTACFSREGVSADGKWSLFRGIGSQVTLSLGPNLVLDGTINAAGDAIAVAYPQLPVMTLTRTSTGRCSPAGTTTMVGSPIPGTWTLALCFRSGAAPNGFAAFQNPSGDVMVYANQQSFRGSISGNTITLSDAGIEMRWTSTACVATGVSEPVTGSWKPTNPPPSWKPGTQPPAGWNRPMCFVKGRLPSPGRSEYVYIDPATNIGWAYAPSQRQAVSVNYTPPNRAQWQTGQLAIPHLPLNQVAFGCTPSE